MKIKAALLAINKSLFFGIGFILFTGLVLLIIWIFGLPVKKADDLKYQLIRTEQQVLQLSCLQSESPSNPMNAGEVSLSEKGRTKPDAISVIRTLKHDVQNYRNFRPFARNKDVSASLADLSVSLNQFETNLKELALAFAERGDATSGLISRWRNLSFGMSGVAAKNGTGIINGMDRIKQKEAVYLLEGNPVTLDEIFALTNEIRASLAIKEGGINISDLDSYLSLTSDLKALDSRIGSLQTGGILYNSENSLDILVNSSTRASLLMNGLIGKIKLKWTIYMYVVIILFTLPCIVLLILITTLGITRPLDSALRFAKRLTFGELPEELIVPEGLPEIREIDIALGTMVLGLKQKVELTRSLNRNELNVNLELCGPQDILGQELITLQKQLINAAELQKRNEIENSQRRYINEGLAKFGELLRTQSQDIHFLGDAFIREIVKYLQAIQGGFFLLNQNHENDRCLELISAFAYNRKKFMQKSIPMGEGLVGTCAIEMQIINLTEIPEGYITITSGLGDTKPDNLLLVPILHETELIGVLEIASLKRFREYEIQFAGEVASSLGSTIIYARNNLRTAELLAKSQQQAVEMTEQEEEMRQNMEELKATQEESGRREEEFRGIAEAIGRVLYVVEYNPDGTIRNANDKFCILVGNTRDEIIGKNHAEIFKGSLKPDARFWDELQKNNQVSQVEKVKIGRKEHALKEHFAVLKNHDGIVIQYINFITELSA